MDHQTDQEYMDMAFEAAKRSKARRKKVGAVLVLAKNGLRGWMPFEGINGMPAGFSHIACEEERHQIDGNPYFQDKVYVKFCKPQPDGTWLTPRHNVLRKVLVTKPEVIHAEADAIMAVTRSHASSVGATLYCTLSPCLECAKLIIQAGIIRVVYAEEYPYKGHSGLLRAPGIELLQGAGIRVDFLANDEELELQDEGRGYEEEPSWRQ